jgi:hypothetical protein
MLNFVKKEYHQIWEANLQLLGPMFQHLFYPDVNVLAFMSNLVPNNKPKMLKVGPKFSWPGLRVWKQALVFFREEK